MKGIVYFSDHFLIKRSQPDRTIDMKHMAQAIQTNGPPRKTITACFFNDFTLLFGKFISAAKTTPQIHHIARINQIKLFIFLYVYRKIIYVDNQKIYPRYTQSIKETTSRVQTQEREGGIYLILYVSHSRRTKSAPKTSKK